MYKIVQIYYDDETLKKCYINQHVTWFYNPVPTVYFENSIIASLGNIIPRYDYFGVWSWKHCRKVHGKGFTFEEFERRFPAVDVFAFQRFLRNGRIFSGEQEKQYTKLFNQLMENLELKYRFPVRLKFVVMQNHFIAKSRILMDYVYSTLIPAMKFMDSSDEYNKQVDYRGPGKYTFKPFICEKLFSAFLNDKNYICEHW